jgi:hypothetical protein
VAESVHPASHDHLAWFITAPGETDVLMVVAAVFFVFSALGIGVVYFWLLALPMQYANMKVQGQIVCVLALIALFTQVEIFWIAALLLALIDFPDLITPIRRIARSVEEFSDIESVDQIPLKQAEANKVETVGQGASELDGAAVVAMKPPKAIQASNGSEQSPIGLGAAAAL